MFAATAFSSIWRSVAAATRAGKASKGMTLVPLAKMMLPLIFRPKLPSLRTSSTVRRPVRFSTASAPASAAFTL